MSNNNSLKQRALSGMVWKLAEKIGMQGMQFVIQIVLARLLMPSEYGIIGLLTIFITVSDVFILQGFTTALIQRKNADDLDFSSVFFANIVVSLVIYIVLFLIAPFVEAFYNMPKLTSFMRILSLNVVFGAIGAVHNAILSRNLDFKKSFYRNTINVITQGAVGIGFAICGFGAWSLVFSKISGTFVGSMVLLATVKWRPKLKFSFDRIRSLFGFSSKVLTTNLLNTIFNNIHSLVIGRYYTSAQLGYYQKGQQIPQAFMTAVDGSFNEVLYPALSSIQNDMLAVKNALRRSMKTSMYIVLPMLLGVIAVAEPLIVVLLTDIWIEAVPFMQLQCLICVFWPLSARTHALNAIGKSDVTLKLSVISKILTVVFIAICIKFGIYAIMLGTVLTSLISFWITSFYVNKYIGYSLGELFLDLLPSIVLSIFMMACVYAVGLLFVNNILAQLCLQIIVGVMVYVFGSIIFRVDSFAYLLDIVKKFVLKKTSN